MCPARNKGLEIEVKNMVNEIITDLDLMVPRITSFRQVTSTMLGDLYSLVTNMDKPDGEGKLMFRSMLTSLSSLLETDLNHIDVNKLFTKDVKHIHRLVEILIAIKRFLRMKPPSSTVDPFVPKSLHDIGLHRNDLSTSSSSLLSSHSRSKSMDSLSSTTVSFCVCGKSPSVSSSCTTTGSVTESSSLQCNCYRNQLTHVPIFSTSSSSPTPSCPLPRKLIPRERERSSLTHVARQTSSDQLTSTRMPSTSSSRPLRVKSAATSVSGINLISGKDQSVQVTMNEHTDDARKTSTQIMSSSAGSPGTRRSKKSQLNGGDQSRGRSMSFQGEMGRGKGVKVTSNGEKTLVPPPQFPLSPVHKVVDARPIRDAMIRPPFLPSVCTRPSKKSDVFSRKNDLMKGVSRRTRTDYDDDDLVQDLAQLKGENFALALGHRLVEALELEERTAEIERRLNQHFTPSRREGHSSASVTHSPRRRPISSFTGGKSPRSTSSQAVTSDGNRYPNRCSRRCTSSVSPNKRSSSLESFYRRLIHADLPPQTRKNILQTERQHHTMMKNMVDEMVNKQLKGTHLMEEAVEKELKRSELLRKEIDRLERMKKMTAKENQEAEAACLKRDIRREEVRVGHMVEQYHREKLAHFNSMKNMEEEVLNHELDRRRKEQKKNILDKKKQLRSMETMDLKQKQQLIQSIDCLFDSQFNMVQQQLDENKKELKIRNLDNTKVLNEIRREVYKKLSTAK